MPTAFNPIKLFSGSASTHLAKQIASAYGKPLGQITFNKYSDGEFQPSFDESVRGCDVFLIQSTFSPSENLLELMLMIDAARRASAHYITAVIPYFGFARQDRKDRPRVPIAAKLIANLLTASGADRVMTMDLHSGQIQGFFDIPVVHLDASVIFIPYIKSLKLKHLTIASPDMGGTARARVFAKMLNVEMVICDKQRKRANEIESMNVIGDVMGMDIVLVDDICDTASTLTKAAQLLKERGAHSVRAVCTHPVLSGKAYENIEHSQLEELIVCDTIPVKKQSPKVRVLSVSELFSRAITNVNEHGSVSDLFRINEHYQHVIQFK